MFAGNFTADGKAFVCASQDHVVYVFDMARLERHLCQNEQKITRLSREQSTARKWIQIGQIGWAILDLALAPDSTTGCIAGWSDTIRIFNINDDSLDSRPISLPSDYLIREHPAIFSARYSPDGYKIVGGLRNGTLAQFGKF